MIKTHRGFSIVILASVLTMFGVLGWIGWQFATMQESTPPVTANGGTNTQQTESKESVQYLIITEWGVKLPLNSAIDSASYTLGTGQWATLTTPRLKEIAATYPECSSAADAIAITRARPGDDNLGSPWEEQKLAQLGKKIGNYYYFPTTGQACFPKHEGFIVPGELTQLNKELITAIKAVQDAQ